MRSLEQLICVRPALCLLSRSSAGAQTSHLVEEAQLALGGLAVCRVHEDASVQQRAVYIRHHGAHIPQAHGQFAVAGALALLHIPAGGQARE